MYIFARRERSRQSGRPNDDCLTGHWPTINKVAGLLMILAAIAEALTSALETIIHLDNR